MSQTLSLYRLQQVDSQIDRLQTRLNQIQLELDDDAELRKVNDRVQAATAHCQSTKTSRK
jgi:predicted  nucleic acid-binding Zn-ribbon protein